MFQLWKLVLLCGLLTGTSASLLGKLGKDLKDVIDEGRETIDDIVKVVAGNLKEDLNRLRDSKVGQLSGQVLQEAENLLTDAVSKVLPIRKDILGLKISNASLLNIQANLSPDGEGLDLNFPFNANVQANLPLIEKVADLKLSADLLSGVRIETQDGRSKVVVTKCVSNPANISLSLLSGRSELANRLVNNVARFLSQTLSTLVEAQVCPLVRIFVNTLNVDFFQNTLDQLQPPSFV